MCIFFFWILIGTIAFSECVGLQSCPEYTEHPIDSTGNFNISITYTWKEYSILNVYKTLSGTVLNGTMERVLEVDPDGHFQFMNSWTSYGPGTYRNGTAIIAVDIVFFDVKVELDGWYTVTFNNSGNKLDTCYFYVMIYAQPTDLSITVIPTTPIDEFQPVEFTCRGNVGRPIGTLWIYRSTVPPSNYSYGVLKVPTENVSYNLLSDRTFYVEHTVTYNVSSSDRGAKFTCVMDNYHHILKRVVSTNDVTVDVNSYGSDINISPQSVVANSGHRDTVTMSCSIGNNLPIEDIVSITMSRLWPNDTHWHPFAGIKAVGANANLPLLDSHAPVDIRDKNPHLEGSISATDPGSSVLSVQFDTSDLGCLDSKALYKCTISYAESGSTDIKSLDSANKTLQIYYRPPSEEIISITARHIQPPNGDSFLRTGQANAGDVAEFSCTGNIGSDTAIDIQWYKTSTTRPGYVVPYKPANSSYIETTSVSVSSSECTYEKTTTARYHLMPSDGDTVGFQCRITVIPPVSNLQKYTVESAVFYISVVGVEGKSSGNDSAAQTGAIVGGVVGGIVFIVLLVVLVYLLLYRRRTETDGDNDEESRNTEISDSVVYSVPHKKKGNGNTGFEESRDSLCCVEENDKFSRDGGDSVGKGV